MTTSRRTRGAGASKASEPSSPATTAEPTNDARGNGLGRGKLGVVAIVFFVVAAAAPLTVLIAGGPLSLRFGGIGAPGAIFTAGVILLLFALGFTAMSRYVRNAGAFYAYVARGFNKPMGGGIALATTVAYALCAMSFLGFIGFYAQETLLVFFGWDTPWFLWSLVFAVIVGVLGYGQVDVGAKVLGALLILELAVIVVLMIAILLQGGPQAPSAEPFLPQNVFFAATSGVLFLFVFGSYIGFEGTAIYSEEAKDPKRTIPIATFVAIAFLAVFYAVMYWVVIYGFGVERALELAQGDEFATMVFVQAEDYLGAWITAALRILIVTSYLACIIAFHNACSRYLFALGRGGVLPKFFAKTHPTMRSPHMASLALSAVCIAVILVASLLNADPTIEIGTWLYASGVVGIVGAQLVCAVAVVAFFARDRRGHSVWRVIVAPALGSLGLATVFVAILINFEYISGYSELLPNLLLIVPTPLAFVIGALLQWRLDRRGEGGPVSVETTAVSTPEPTAESEEMQR